MDNITLRNSLDIAKNPDFINICTKEKLYNLYITENRSIKNIAEICNSTRNTVKKYLKKFDISKDPKTRYPNKNKFEFIDYNYIKLNYIDLNKSIVEISAETGISKSAFIYRLKKYGMHKAVKESRKKALETNIKRYGTEYPMKNPKIKEKRVLYKKDIQYYFNNRENAIETLSILFENKKPSINDILFKFPSLSYSTVENMIHRLGIEDHVSMFPSRSKYEDEISIILKEWGIKNIILNDKNILNGKEIDVYLPDYNIGIEFNGSYWHSEKYLNSQYHLEKSLFAKERGVFIYHIFGYEWKNINIKNRILNHLKSILHANEYKIYARKCYIKEISNLEKNNFLDINHIKGKDESTIKLGLYYKNELMTVMTFNKLDSNNVCNWELTRFCSRNNYNIIGGISKLFSHFVKEYMHEEDSIVSYSDIGKSQEKLYEILNFSYSGISNPNYIWWKTDLEYRIPSNLDDEIDKMHDLGYLRLYDCGNKVWIYRKETRN